MGSKGAQTSQQQQEQWAKSMYTMRGYTGPSQQAWDVIPGILSQSQAYATGATVPAPVTTLRTGETIDISQSLLPTISGFGTQRETETQARLAERLGMVSGFGTQREEYLTEAEKMRRGLWEEATRTGQVRLADLANILREEERYAGQLTKEQYGEERTAQLRDLARQGRMVSGAAQRQWSEMGIATGLESQMAVKAAGRQALYGARTIEEQARIEQRDKLEQAQLADTLQLGEQTRADIKELEEKSRVEGLALAEQTRLETLTEQIRQIDVSIAEQQRQISARERAEMAALTAQMAAADRVNEILNLMRISTQEAISMAESRGVATGATWAEPIWQQMLLRATPTFSWQFGGGG